MDDLHQENKVADSLANLDEVFDFGSLSDFLNQPSQDSFFSEIDPYTSPGDSSSHISRSPLILNAERTLSPPLNLYELAHDNEPQRDSILFPNSWNPSVDSVGDATAVGSLSASWPETSEPLSSLNALTDDICAPSVGSDKTNGLPPKIGARFSRECVRILKRWLALHSHHPYPSEDDKLMLQRDTGLSKTQVSNWLTNARRKRNAQTQRPTFFRAGPKASTLPIDVRRRPGTPAPKSNIHDMDPLQRWVDSPPENEAASTLAISRAITSNFNGSLPPNSAYSFTSADEGFSRSLCDSSESSAGQPSVESSVSSCTSGTLFGSFGSMNRSQSRRRRRKRAMPKREKNLSLVATLKPYQCTFCTETFRTKHDWQRHEKSLHLSLEMWTCAPQGPRVISPKTSQLCCVFCGKVEPDDDHMQSHNFSPCHARSLEEKTFYRKDHLNQHLRLVHDVQFLDWCMKTWKVSIPEVRSRCGFCGIMLNSWPVRVEHLAEHFKTGKTMADWNGDWGFEPSVLDMLRNAIPPYLIEMERNSPFPFVASCAPAESPRTAYEIITTELEYYMVNYKEETGLLASTEDLRLEACRIVFASEALSQGGISTEYSWLRDLLMAEEEIARQARFAPLRRGAENKLCILKINGKDNLFEDCPLELQLQRFIRAKALLGRNITDEELQKEAFHIIRRIEEVSSAPSDIIANWIMRLIMSSTTWLSPFRRRARLPKSQNDVSPASQSGSVTQIDWTVNTYSGLGQFLDRDMQSQRAVGPKSSDEALGQDDCELDSEANDDWKKIYEDNVDWGDVFGQLHSQSPRITTRKAAPCSPPITMHDVQQQRRSHLASDRFIQTAQGGQQTTKPRAYKAMLERSFFLNDTNYYRRVAQELTRFVVFTMSPNNPNRHVPTDAELQYQARWILFDSDDPWNQTAADNDEWLERFKRDIGILPPGPGLDIG